jgi:Na+/H+ antiporter NhaC
MNPGVAPLIPVFVTLVVAFAARNVLVGLFCGVFAGVALLADTSLLMFVPELIGQHIVPEVADGYNASVLVLLVFIGGFVKLIEFSGGGTAFTPGWRLRWSPWWRSCAPTSGRWRQRKM